MSVYKPKGSPYFQYDFQRGGVRFHGSTSCTARREAEAFERVEKKKAAEPSVAPARAAQPTISAAWVRFWEEKGQHDAKSDTTFARMEVLQDGLSLELRQRGRPAAITEIDADAIAAYVSKRRGVTGRTGNLLSNGSVNRELQILRRIMRRAQRVWRMAVHLPAWDELMLPERDERVVDLSRAVEQDIIGRMRPDFQAAARWLILSGLRAGNALPLDPAVVDFAMGFITIMQKSRKPGGRRHILPITPTMDALLKREMGKSPEAVFTYQAVRTRDGRIRGQRYPITPETFYNAFKAAAIDAGYPDLRPMICGMWPGRGRSGHQAATSGQLKSTWVTLGYRPLRNMPTTCWMSCVKLWRRRIWMRNRAACRREHHENIVRDFFGTFCASLHTTTPSVSHMFFYHHIARAGLGAI